MSNLNNNIFLYTVDLCEYSSKDEKWKSPMSF